MMFGMAKAFLPVGKKAFAFGAFCYITISFILPTIGQIDIIVPHGVDHRQKGVKRR